MPSLTHRTLSGFFWQSSVAGANVVIRTFVLIVLARHLSARDFGIVAAAMVVATITQVFAQIGVTQAIVQRLTITSRHVRTGFAVALYTGIAAGLVLLLGAPLFGMLFRMPEVEPVVRLFSTLLVLNGIAAVPIALLQRAHRFKVSATIELVAFVLGYGVIGIALTFSGFGLWALACAQIAQVSSRTILYLLAAPPAMTLRPDRQELNDLLHVGSGFSLGQIANLVATQVDNFIVGRMLGAEPLGLYSRAYQFLMLPAQLLGTAAQTVLFPSIAAIQDQPERVARACLRAIGVVAMVTLPLSGVLAVLAPELVHVALGKRWVGMIPPFQILVLSLMFRTSYKISDSVALAFGAMRPRAARQAAYAVAVALGSMVGSAWGLTGVAAGVALAVVLNFFMMLQLALKLTGIPAAQVAAVHFRHALVSVPMVAVAYLATVLDRNMHLHDLWVLILGCGAAGAVAAILWWRFRWVFGDDAEWAHAQAMSRLGSRKTKPA
jgi:PST family polysaccharide transporter